MNFTGKNIVITGGTTGIGFATANAFIEAGANVWITGRNIENLEKAATSLGNERIKTVISDTSNLNGIEALTKAIADSGQKLDVLFLNAGIATFAPIAEATEADFDAQFNTNVKGPYFTLQKLLPYLKDGASIVFNSSTVATAAQMYGSVYSATKGALNKIAQIAANELAGRNIRVNMISPGPTQTEGFDKAVTDDTLKKQLALTTAMQRMGKPSEIAKAVLFLASEDASFITGAQLLVDGGFIGYALK
ncbi:NAD(P)-dependent dehydrogenase (short-subunit alcohol dehydrogenase family) [Pedobacter sp. W3I1]|uniref:SDR family oxidoreductase n=1 Tax=Pedobacter sp. W3I1 TaxID=3042291 RepID=UPI00277E1C24|nr:SDR family oxidoreductase [Pedobacter sp. W3I1]MDQ0639586.1 NAD(P)-dependent dehydrogenase (short-subunit alcohol dehydrogenase family) [Pedobacter sp. W3I1]